MKPETPSSTRAEWLAAALVTLVIIALQMKFWLQAGAFWRDEVNTINLAQSPSYAALSHDTFPVLLPLLVKIWSAVGRSDLWLRFLGLLAGVGIIAAFWTVARTTHRPPLFSLVLFGLNLVLLVYGSSLRAYGLGSAMVVFALAAAWAFLKHPRWPRAGVLALAFVLSVQTLFQNAVLVFAICAGATAVCARRKDLPAVQKIFLAGLVAALSLLPYHATFAGLPQAAVELRRGFSLPVAYVNFEAATAFPFGFCSVIWEILAVGVIGFALLSLRPSKTHSPVEDSGLAVFAGVSLVSVVVMYLGFLWFAAAGARPWYFMPPLALAAACFDFGIPWMRLPQLVRATASGLLVGTALVAASLAVPGTRETFTNADRIAQQLAAGASPQDFIVVTPWYCGITFDRYFHGPTPWDTLPPLADHTLHRYDLVLTAMKDTNSLAPLLAKISATLQAGHRVWVVGELEWPPDVSEVPPVLPPPPLAGYGWTDPPYMGSWAWRTSYLLAQHSNHFAPVPVPDEAAPKFQENLHLFMAEGWKM